MQQMYGRHISCWGQLDRQRQENGQENVAIEFCSGDFGKNEKNQ